MFAVAWPIPSGRIVGMRLVTVTLVLAACTSTPPAAPHELDPMGTWKVTGTFGDGTCGSGADYTWQDGFIVEPADAGFEVKDIFSSMPTSAAVGCTDTHCTLLAVERLPADGGGEIEDVTTLELVGDAVTGSGRITVTGSQNCYMNFTARGVLAPVQAQQ